MQYYFVFASIGGRYKDVPFPYIQEIDPPLRPVLGQVVDIKRKQYKVNRCSPSNNPSDQAVTYYLELYNPTYKQLPKKRASNSTYGTPTMTDI